MQTADRRRRTYLPSRGWSWLQSCVLFLPPLLFLLTCHPRSSPFRMNKRRWRNFSLPAFLHYMNVYAVFCLPFLHIITLCACLLDWGKHRSAWRHREIQNGKEGEAILYKRLLCAIFWGHMNMYMSTCGSALPGINKRRRLIHQEKCVRNKISIHSTNIDIYFPSFSINPLPDLALSTSWLVEPFSRFGLFVPDLCSLECMTESEVAVA